MYRDEEQESIPILIASPIHTQDGNIVGEPRGFQPPNQRPTIYPKKIEDNFLLLCVAFSINHGCVVSLIAYAAPELGNRIGSLFNGILYVCFGISAILFANPVVNCFGAKGGLQIGFTGYSFYVLGFLCSIVSLLFNAPTLSWVFACVSAGLGGLAGGVLWVSQGRSFGLHAKLYASCTDTPIEIVNSDYAARFAAYFLGTEMALKVLSSVVYIVATSWGPYLIVGLYSLLAVSAAFASKWLLDLEDTGSGKLDFNSVSEYVGRGCKLLCADKRLALILPFQMSFGFTSVVINFYVLGTVVKNKEYVGLLSAVVVYAGAMSAYPFARLSRYYGKDSIIFVGNLCMLLIGLLLLVVSDKQLERWTFMIPYLLIAGMGRGVWENTNKAVIADFFPNSDNLTSAFSIVTLFTAYSTSVGYFTFFAVTRDQMIGMVLFFSMLSLISYHFGFVAHQHVEEKQLFELQKRELVRRQYADHCRLQEDGDSSNGASNGLSSSSSSGNAYRPPAAVAVAKEFTAADIAEVSPPMPRGMNVPAGFHHGLSGNAGRMKLDSNDFL